MYAEVNDQFLKEQKEKFGIKNPLNRLIERRIIMALLGYKIINRIDDVEDGRNIIYEWLNHDPLDYDIGSENEKELLTKICNTFGLTLDFSILPLLSQRTAEVSQRRITCH